MPRMSDDELKALVMDEAKSADVMLAGELSKQRSTAMNYYLGEPYGNEVDGRSKVVTTEVADTIEWILPSLLKIFTAGDEVVKFEAVGPEDEPQATQRTEYANHVFLQDNPGFMILYTWFKDALLQKNGFVKAWWEETTETKSETFEGLNDMQFTTLVQQPDVKVVAYETREVEVQDPASGQAFPMQLHDVRYEITTTAGKIVIENVPPEEFLISREAKDIKTARFCAHKVKRTRSELIEMGYPRKLVDDLPAYDNEAWDSERIARFANDKSDEQLDDTADKAMRPVWLTEAYVRVDYDGDGIAELRKVTIAGTQAYGELLDNEPWEEDRAPFYSLTPIILPHRFYGLSVADQVMDLQLIKSTVLRQLLDNMYLTNNSRWIVNPHRVELDDFLESRPGGVVRTVNETDEPASAAVPLITSPLAPGAWAMLEYIDALKENRTGITRYNQGLDADTLNKTASGISQIMSASQQRIELIARIFAETGVKELFQGIDAITIRHQDIPRTIRIRNEWVDIDPRTWTRTLDATVAVGLGTGNRMEMQAQLTNLLSVQQGLVQAGKGYLVSDENIYNTVSKLIGQLGLKNAELYISQPPEQPPQPPPDPKMIEAQVNAETKRMSVEADVQLKQARNAADIEMQREKNTADIMLQRERLNAEMALQARKLDMQHQVAMKQAEQRAAEQRARAQ